MGNAVKWAHLELQSPRNERRSHRMEAARFFGVKALRDVRADQFESQADQLALNTRKRAHHFISENHRTLQAAEAS
jgi:galactokinase